MKKKIIYTIIVVISITIIVMANNQYTKFFKPNVTELPENKVYLFIPTGANFQVLLDSVKESKSLIDYSSFEKTARLKNLSKHIYPGKYCITNNMNNNEIVNMFRSGKQSFVSLSFNNIRTKEQLAGVISKQIEADSSSIINLLKDFNALSLYGLDKDNTLTSFIPNTYEFYWNTNAQKFFSRMNDENKKFWNKDRLDKAKDINMKPIEISILASIIDEETKQNSEKQRIAGVYINRLKRGIPLQADPTVKFALNDLFKRRITKKDTEVDSPYNTYKYNGLPPGPIRIPSITSIDAILNYEKHSYYYFCAKDDFSGYHVFAKTNRQHNQNARKYHKALNRNNIYK